MGVRTPIGRGLLASLLALGTLVMVAQPASAGTVSGTIVVGGVPATITRAAAAVTVTADVTTTENSTFDLDVSPSAFTPTFTGGGTGCASQTAAVPTSGGGAASCTVSSAGVVTMTQDGGAPNDEAVVLRITFKVQVPSTVPITSPEGTTGQAVTFTVSGTATGTTTGTLTNGTANTTIVPNSSGGTAEAEIRVVSSEPSPTSLERGPLAKTTYSATFSRFGKTNQVTAVDVQLLSGAAQGTSVSNPTVSNDASPDACTFVSSGSNCAKITFPSGGSPITVTFDVSVPATADVGTTSYAFKGTYDPTDTDGSPLDVENGTSKSFTVLTDSAPNTTIDTGTSGPISTTSASFTFSSDEVGATFECKLDGPGATTGTFESCTSPKNYTSLADGDYSFSVRAVDNIGNPDASPDTRTFTVDTAAPETTIESGPSGATNDNDPVYTFSSDEDPNATFECKLDGPGTTTGTFTSCTSPQSYTDLADGDYTFSVKATDAAGNTDATEASLILTVDTAAPETTIDDGPGTTNDGTADFEFSTNEDPLGATFECKLDGPGTTTGTFTPCTSPQSYPGLSDGEYTFSVKTTDAAGNTDASEATEAFTVDSTPPETTIDNGPGSVNDGTVTYEFSSDDANATFECKLDGPGATTGTFEACTSPKEYTGLADGEYAFSVKATDAANNTDASADTDTFTIDQTAPTTTIDDGPGSVNDGTVTYEFSSDDPNATFECKLDGPGATTGTFEACTSPKEYTGLTDENYTFSVRATDTTGNTGTADTDAFTIDSVAPNTAIDSGPLVPEDTADGIADFTFSSDEPIGGTFVCRLDGPGATPGTDEPCNTGSMSYAGLTDGEYTFSVKATDAAGNTDPDAATHTFTVVVVTPPTSTCFGYAVTHEGTDSSETIYGTDGRDIIAAKGGHDIIVSRGGNDVICAGTGNDQIYGGEGNDGLLGEAGNDIMLGGPGADRLSGGDGTNDIASYYDHPSAVKASLGTAQADDGNESDGPSGARDLIFSNVEGLIGGAGADSLIGNGIANSLNGAGGNDALAGGSGNDTLNGHLGSDKLYGGYGRDSVIGGTGADSLYGQGDGDYLYAKDSARDTRIDGGSGSDVAYRDAVDPAPISVP